VTTPVAIALAILVFWIAPIYVAHQVGVRGGRHDGWVFGILGSWIGVAVAAALIPKVDEPDVQTHTRNPLGRLFPNMPHGWRVALDWIFTIAGAVAVVVALKLWVVNPYRIPSSSMEPTLHCARPAEGCLARFSDRVLANRFIYHFEKPHRGDIVVFRTPHNKQGQDRATLMGCEGGTFVKRLIGLPDDRLKEDRAGFVYVRSPGSQKYVKLNEPYVKPDRRGPARQESTQPWIVPKNSYFFMGDNRRDSCDSRVWGSVPRKNLIGKVFFVYWPPNRIGLP
jgi:signal peptidase I